MTRPLRIEFPGALYHVTCRGDRREDIFFDEADRLLWLPRPAAYFNVGLPPLLSHPSKAVDIRTILSTMSILGTIKGQR